jgi:hypothetical protein
MMELDWLRGRQIEIEQISSEVTGHHRDIYPRTNANRRRSLLRTT